MTNTFFDRLSLVILGCATALILMGWDSSLHAQTVAVMVNGEPITNYDIEQRGKLITLSSHKPADRQQVLDELIDEKVKIKEAKKFGIDPTSTEVDQSYATMSGRMHVSPEQLTKSLESQGIRPDTLKSRIRTEMVWSNLVRGRYKESLQISEKDVDAATNAVEVKGDEKPAGQSYEYRMQPIVLVVPRGSEASTVETKRKEAEALRARIQSCDEANAFFKSMPNAAIREIVTRTSADMPLTLRELLDGTPIGHLTPPEVTKQGVEMVVLCGRTPTKIDTPKKKEIRDKMFAEKYDAKSKAYLKDVRGSAMIEYPNPR